MPFSLSEGLAHRLLRLSPGGVTCCVFHEWLLVRERTIALASVLCARPHTRGLISQKHSYSTCAKSCGLLCLIFCCRTLPPPPSPALLRPVHMPLFFTAVGFHFVAPLAASTGVRTQSAQQWAPLPTASRHSNLVPLQV